MIGYFANGAEVVKATVMTSIATHGRHIRMLKRRRSVERERWNTVAGIAIRAGRCGQVIGWAIGLMAACAAGGDRGVIKAAGRVKGSTALGMAGFTGGGG